jgi:hypothetical protein
VGTDIDVSEGVGAPADEEYFHFVAIVEDHAEGPGARVLQIVEGAQDLAGMDAGWEIHGDALAAFRP